MHVITKLLLSIVISLALAGCSGGSSDSAEADPHAGTHTHADGSVHDDHAPEADAHSGTHTHADGSVHEDHAPAGGGHAHDEVPLGTAMIGDMQVTFGQGHGAVEAGKEGHLAIKLPYSDNGATVVRAWIGTDDRTLSYVGKGHYAASGDDYDVHAVAPDPLPANAMWWIEVEKPDGSKIVGSVKPITG